MAVTIRHVQPSDYGRVIQHVNEWWGGREMAPMLPRLFFIHFESTSFVADREDGTLAGFLIGFLSQTDDETAYVHFVGVAPAERGSGLGRELYERFFDAGPRERPIGGPLRHLAAERELARVPRRARLRAGGRRRGLRRRRREPRAARPHASEPSRSRHEAVTVPVRTAA